MAFEIPDINFLLDLIEKVYQHNLKVLETGDQTLLLFFEKTLNQISAATRIQCAYRLYKWKVRQSLTPLTKIMERRAAVCMQRGWRKWVLQHRLTALINISKACEYIDQPEFYIEATTYMNLRRILSREVTRWRFEEQ